MQATTAAEMTMPRMLLTDAKPLANRLRHHAHLWPEMTLEGILHSQAR